MPRHWITPPRLHRALALGLALFGLSAAATAAPAPAFPRTMYKAADIERAKQNIERHPWAKAQWETIRKSAEPLLAMSRDELRAHISDKTGISHFKCPKDGQYFLWYYSDFTDNTHNTLKCKNCGAEYTLDESAPEGYNVNSVIRSRRLAWVVGGLDAAGIAYQITGDRRYAEKAAILIERYAEVYKGHKTNDSVRQRWQEIPPHPYHAKADGWAFRDAAHMQKMLLAYDLIHDSGVLTLQQIEMIDRDLVAYTRDCYLAGYENTTDPQGRTGPLWASPSIQDQGYKWWCVAATGALLNDTKTLQLMVDTYADLLNPANGYFYEDGTFFQGSADYNKQFLSPSLGTPEIIRGNLPVDIYSDPRCKLLGNCFGWMVDYMLPNGTILAINDSHRGSTYPENYAEIAWLNYGNQKALAYLKDQWGADLSKGDRYSLFFRAPDAVAGSGNVAYSRDSHHLQGMGLMILRADEPTTGQAMAWLDYGAYRPVGKPAAHKHRDYLNIGLYAAGEEMLTEYGYSHDPDWYLAFQQGPWSHVSALELAGGHRDKGEPHHWAPTPDAKMAEAGRSGKESRFLALIPRGKASPLVVDIFRCDGLSSATWLMHARSDTLALEGTGDLTTATLPHPFTEAKSAVLPGNLAAAWTFERGQSLRLAQLGGVGRKVTTAFAPPEEDKIDPLDYEETTRQAKPGVNPPKRAHIVINDGGQDPVFISVLDPGKGERPALRVERLDVTGDARAIALRITAGDESFVVIHNPAGGKAEAAGLALDGRAAVLAERHGRPGWLSLGGAKSAMVGARTLTANAEGTASQRW